MDVNELLMRAFALTASDLHLSANLSPMIRVDGELRPLDPGILSHQVLINWLNGVLNEQQQQTFAQQLDLDFATEVQGIRCRVNVFKQSRGLALALRLIPSTLVNLEALGLPPIVQEATKLYSGLVLITGATGSGKSTTLAALIDDMNAKRAIHIVSIEDPIEYVHHSKRAIIHQREIARDSHSFHAALRAALREDPDVICIGELRDLETIRLALSAAETGHLVLASLHTSAATKSIHRIIHVFPAAEQALARSMLSETLQMVITQHLLQKNQGGRVAAIEIMNVTPAIRHLIREDKLSQIYSNMQTGQAYGMNTLDQHLQQLVVSGQITAKTALDVALNKGLFAG